GDQREHRLFTASTRPPQARAGAGAAPGAPRGRAKGGDGMTLGPELQQLVDAARELDAEPPDIEGRMWAAISAAVGPGATPAPEADVSASPSGAVSTLPTVIKGAALGLAGIGLAVGIARVIPSETASGRAL